MKDYALLPADWMADAERLHDRLQRSFEHVATLPAKPARAPAKNRAG